MNATLGELEKRGCWHSGTNQTDAEQKKATIVEKGGIRFAMLSFTCDMNGNSYDKPYQINEVRFNDVPCDISMVEIQVRSAKDQQADLVIVHAHWGWEFEMYPHTNTVEIAHKIAETGVDVIVGTHPHVAQPMERYEYVKDGHKKQCLIIYSLGDFVSYHPVTMNSRLTYVVRFDAVKGLVNGVLASRITNLKMLPVYILAASDKNENFDFRLLRFSSVRNDLPDENQQYRYALTQKERTDLPRLEKVLHTILLPDNYQSVLAK